jgi:hypothetical protein
MFTYIAFYRLFHNNFILSIYFFEKIKKISPNVPAVYDVLPAWIRALRSILSEGKATRAGKLWAEVCVGMFRPKVCA